MAPITSNKKPLGSVLVIGGCGFLGHHIVNQLLSSYDCKVSVLDLTTNRNRSSSPSVSYFDGDITSLSSILPVFEKIKPGVVIHTASPTAMAGLTGGNALYYRVNVEGTNVVIEACQKTGVKALVYTSSASVISDNASDIVNADERWPIIPPKSQTEYYSTTKAWAETAVLAANRSSDFPKLLTCVIRPAGIFGEGDVQTLPAMASIALTSKPNFQLGTNENLFDFTYVGNIAHAHLLAAHALLATSGLKTAPLDHEKVDGEAFVITNDEPVYFWDFARAVWKAAGREGGTENVRVIGKEVGLALAGVMEWGMWAVGRKATLTRRVVKYSCMVRYYDCGKAKIRLGYKPITSLEEGIEKGVKWWLEEQKATGEKKVL